MEDYKFRNPAYPQPVAIDPNGNVVITWDRHVDFIGFTKLEKAALTIGAGMVGGAWSDQLTDKQAAYIAEASLILAKAILNECNK